ncbi:hypothetical protein D3L32_20435 [Salmonella enterica]|nr:hypothetical protein [Salmonella enterica]
MEITIDLGRRTRIALRLSFPFSVFRFPFSVFRFPFSVFRFPFSVLIIIIFLFQRKKKTLI